MNRILGSYKTGTTGRRCTIEIKYPRSVIILISRITECYDWVQYNTIGRYVMRIWSRRSLEFENHRPVVLLYWKLQSIVCNYLFYRCLSAAVCQIIMAIQRNLSWLFKAQSKQTYCGGNKDGTFSASERSQRLLALSLRAVAVNAVHLVSLDVQEVLECVGAFLRLNKDQSEGIRPCRNVIVLLYITGFDLKCKLLKHRPMCQYSL